VLLPDRCGHSATFDGSMVTEISLSTYACPGVLEADLPQFNAASERGLPHVCRSCSGSSRPRRQSAPGARTVAGPP